MSAGPDFQQIFQVIFGIAGFGFHLLGIGVIAWMWASSRHPSLILIGASSVMNFLISLSGYTYGLVHASMDFKTYHLIVQGVGVVAAMLGLAGCVWLFRWVLSLLQYRDLVEWSRNNMPPSGPGQAP